MFMRCLLMVVVCGMALARPQTAPLSGKVSLVVGATGNSDPTAALSGIASDAEMTLVEKLTIQIKELQARIEELEEELE